MKEERVSEVICGLSIIERWSLSEVKLVSIIKIMIRLRKAKPEWYSPSDIRLVIFADVY